MTAEPGVTKYNVSEENVHGKFRVLSLEKQILRDLKQILHYKWALTIATSKGKDQSIHLRTAGVVQACHNFLISQTGFQQPGFWITMVGFRIPLAGFRIPKPWILDSTDQNYMDSGFRITLHGAKHPFLLFIKSCVRHVLDKGIPTCTCTCSLKFYQTAVCIFLTTIYQFNKMVWICCISERLIG